MKLSIIICTYNRKKELKRALGCVFGQKTDFAYEVVVGNDCSTDGTGEALKAFQEKYEERLVVSTLEKNSGVGTNWAKAVMLAKGEYLAFLDDDYWTDDRRMQTMVDYLEAHPDILHFSACTFNMDKGVREDRNNLAKATFGIGLDYFRENALQKTGLAFGYVCFRVWKTRFLRDFELRFKEGIYFEDTLFTTIACYYAKKVKIINDCLYNYRIHKESITNDPAKKTKRSFDLVTVANELSRFYIPKTGFDKTIIYRYITYQFQIPLMFMKLDDKRQEVEVFRSCDWKSYGIVSRTKLRHRLNYLKNWTNYKLHL